MFPFPSPHLLVPMCMLPFRHAAFFNNYNHVCYLGAVEHNTLLNRTAAEERGEFFILYVFKM